MEQNISVMVTVRQGAEPRARTAARPLDLSPIVLRRVSLAKGVCDARRRVASGSSKEPELVSSSKELELSESLEEADVEHI